MLIVSTVDNNQLFAKWKIKWDEIKNITTSTEEVVQILHWNSYIGAYVTKSIFLSIKYVYVGPCYGGFKFPINIK